MKKLRKFPEINMSDFQKNIRHNEEKKPKGLILLDRLWSTYLNYQTLYVLHENPSVCNL